jgi:hypothetical protein
MVNLLSNIFRHKWFGRNNQNLEKQTCKLTENVTALHPPNHLRGQPILRRSFVSPGPCVKPVAGRDTNKQTNQAKGRVDPVDLAQKNRNCF